MITTVGAVEFGDAFEGGVGVGEVVVGQLLALHLPRGRDAGARPPGRRTPPAGAGSRHSAASGAASPATASARGTSPPLRRRTTGDGGVIGGGAGIGLAGQPAAGGQRGGTDGNPRKAGRRGATADRSLPAATVASAPKHLGPQSTRDDPDRYEYDRRYNNAKHHELVRSRRTYRAFDGHDRGHEHPSADCHSWRSHCFGRVGLGTRSVRSRCFMVSRRTITT